MQKTAEPKLFIKRRLSLVILFKERDQIGKLFLLYNEPEERESACTRNNGRTGYYSGDCHGRDALTGKALLAGIALFVTVLINVEGLGTGRPFADVTYRIAVI